MTGRRLKGILIAIFCIVLLGPLYAYDPPAGGSLLMRVFSPWAMGAGISVTESGWTLMDFSPQQYSMQIRRQSSANAPWAFAANPASPAVQELAVLDLSAALLADSSAGLSVPGAAAGAAFSIPVPYGVWSGAARIFAAPTNPADMPLGTFGMAGAAFSKSISEHLSFGASLWFAIGGNSSLGWGLWADIGIIRELADIGSGDKPFLKNPRIGFVMRGIGKEFNYASPPAGIAGGAGSATGFPAAFTPGIGFSASLVESESPRLGIRGMVDLMAPSFSTLEFQTGLAFQFGDAVSARLAWGINLYDQQLNAGRSLFPSLSISGRIPLKSSTLKGSNEEKPNSISSIAPAIGYQPLYGSLSAVSMGAQLAFGQPDRSAPIAELDPSMPIRKPIYVSIGGEGDLRTLKIPVRLYDEQKGFSGWELRIVDQSAASKEPIRIIRGGTRPPEKIRTFSDLKAGLGYVRKPLAPVDFIEWDGKDSKGKPVPEGVYIASIHAWDEAGNQNTDLDLSLIIVVDRTPPAGNAWVVPEDRESEGPHFLKYSPDGSQLKISLHTQGSVEDSWKYEIIDKDGKIVRTYMEQQRSAPADFTWDGTDDSGRRAPDGYYRFRLSSADAAGNKVERTIGTENDRSFSDWLLLDSTKPKAAIMAERSALSPNGDGIMDTLPLSFSYESLKNLYSWNAYVKDRNGKAIWSASGDGKSAPPAALDFSGKDSNGQPLADGYYTVSVELEYRNAHKFTAESAPILVDSIPPSGAVKREDAISVFSPDGDGRRDSMAFSLQSSQEELWELAVLDMKGTVVKLERYREKLPERFVWDGNDDTGKRVPDGQYVLKISSTDTAGNAFSQASEPVIVDTRRPQAQLALARDAFSPNDDGVADYLETRISLDDSRGLSAWKLEAVREARDSAEARVTLLQGSGTTLPPTLWRFDGKSPAGPLSEGMYRFVLSYAYDHGWAGTVTSQEFAIDTTAPYAQVERSLEHFNPLGRDDQKIVRIRQSGSVEGLWIGEIRDRNGKVRRKWEFHDSAPSDIEWDGRAVDGALLEDGTYVYRLICVDAAGNSFASPSLSISIDTMMKQSSLAVDYPAFSPNGDGVRDRAEFSISITAPERVKNWKLSIQAIQGSAGLISAPVMEWSGTSPVPASIQWAGTSSSGLPAPDGAYRATFMASYPNGDITQAVLQNLVIDRQAPRAEVSIGRLLFSPNGDGVNDTLPIVQNAVPGDDWIGEIVDVSGNKVRRWTWSGTLPSFEWDGRDDAGNTAPDGKYKYRLASEDAAGNRFLLESGVFEIETEKKAVRLAIGDRAFSPNGDGKKDVMVLRAEVTSPEKVQEYLLQIVAQDGPLALTAVRTWKGTMPPSLFEWRGEADTQRPAPDGTYAASLRVVYRNGDVAEAATGSFVLDRIFPKIEAAVQGAIFSPDGDGRNDSITIRQRSVPGDSWNAKVRDASGRAIRVWKWEYEVTDLVWDGRDSNGAVVPDGIYEYVIESEDSAGNWTFAGPFRIQVETGKRQVVLRTNESAISPNGDGIKDQLVLYVSADARDRIESYSLVIQDSEGAAVKTWKGTQDLLTEYRWDGMSDRGTPVPDGQYVISIEVQYLNGAFASAGPARVLVDRAAPSAQVSLARSIFSPNGDGRADTLTIAQSSVSGDRWNGQIISETGRIMKTWEWYPVLADVVWDGKDHNGRIVPDGVYYYELRSIDDAGNSFILPRQRIVVDAAPRNPSMKVDPPAFSPNDDGVKDVCYFNLNVPASTTLLKYELAIWAGTRPEAAKVPIRRWAGINDIRNQYAWDGKTDSGILVPDGSYAARLILEYANGDYFELGPVVITVDTVPPKITVSAEPLLFSPNGDGIRDVIMFTQDSVPGDDWTGRIRNASGTVVRSYSWKGRATSFTWDGKDASGKLASNGIYSYEVVSVDAAGNSASATIKGITLDASTPRVFVSASDSGISPNGDGIRDTVSFSLTVEQREGVESWRFSLIDQNGIERSFFGGTGADVPTRLVWDGRDLQGQVVQGTYVGRLVVRYLKGDVAEAKSTPVMVDIEPPRVNISVKPEYFSPDGDGVDDVCTFGITTDANAGIVDWKLEIFETAVVESSGTQEAKPTRSFIYWSGKNRPPSMIVWDGKSSKGELVESATDYPFEFTAWDALGNQTKVKGLVAVDVLVIRDGDRLKIKVPSIVFRANHADFIGLSAETVARNQKVVARIAEILNKFPDYRIRIEGHGNNIGKMLGYTAARIQQEEVNELIPLSTERAEVVRRMLVENGVDARRLTTSGLGSSEPVVPFTDAENRWKNRRVEFVLIRNQ